MTSTMKKYTVGVKVPNKTNENKPFNPCHMTVTFPGDLDEKMLAELVTDMESIARVIQIQFGKWDTFGSDEMIAAGKGFQVKLCSIVSPTDRQALVDLHKKWGKPDNGMPLLAEPNFHVSKRTIGDELDTMDSAKCSEWFIKELGPNPPIWTRNL